MMNQTEWALSIYILYKQLYCQVLMCVQLLQEPVVVDEIFLLYIPIVRIFLLIASRNPVCQQSGKVINY